MGRNGSLSAVPLRCLGQQAHSGKECAVTSIMLRLAATCAKWNLNPRPRPRGFIEGFRPKDVSHILLNNMPCLHGLGTYVILCTPLRQEQRCNQQGHVSYGPGTRLRTLHLLGLRPGLTSKPVYNPGYEPGHALTYRILPQRTSGRHEVSHHASVKPGTTCLMLGI